MRISCNLGSTLECSLISLSHTNSTGLQEIDAHVTVNTISKITPAGVYFCNMGNVMQ